LNELSKQTIIKNYRNLFLKHRSGPEVGQWSAEGQQFRFEKLIQIANLKDRSVLDLGCGIGDLYPFLVERFGRVDYTGIDIVPELVAAAVQRHPDARFLCRDLLSDDIDETFNYVLINGMFNNAVPDCTAFLKEMINVAFRHCSIGLGFNFITTYVNRHDAEMAYHDPLEILDFCLKTLTHNVMLHHHYERCDVAVFVYR
jgi:SAM-dependent methyltransferase